MKTYVAGFLFSEDTNEVLLIRKTKPAWQAGRLNAIGGKIEAGETPLQAMQREFREETSIDTADWFRVCDLTGDDFIVHFFYGASDALMQEAKTTTEEIVVRTGAGYTFEMLPNLEWLIPMAKSLYNGNDRAICFNVAENYV